MCLAWSSYLNCNKQFVDLRRRINTPLIKARKATPRRHFTGENYRIGLDVFRRKGISVIALNPFVTPLELTCSYLKKHEI